MRWVKGARLRIAAVIVLGAVAWVGSGRAAEAPEKEVEEAQRLARESAALYQAGKVGAAIPLAERALALRERAPDPDPRQVAQSLNDLALLHDSRGEHALAEPLHERALALREKTLGPWHEEVAESLNNLAELYRAKAAYTLAEPLYERARAIFEKAMGPDSRYVATALGNLALVYQAEGEYARAESFFERALAIDEKALGPDDPDLAIDLENLGLLSYATGNADRAEPLFQRAIAILERSPSADRSAVAQAYINLALLWGSRGEYDRAEPLYQRAMVMLESSLGPDHPVVATLLNDLAMLHKAKGEYARADPLYQRAVSILERSLGPDDPHVADALQGLSASYWASGRISEAIPPLIRGLEMQEKTLGRLVDSGCEAQKLAYLTPYLGESDVTTTLALHTSDARAAHLALLTLFRRKGRALDVMADSMRALRARFGPEEQRLFDELEGARSRYVALALRSSGGTLLDAYLGELAVLNEQIQQHEATISARSEASRANERPLTVAAVQAALPDEAALVEWTVYKPFDPRAHIPHERLAAARYAVCVLRAHGAPVWVDLGDAAAIDAGVQALRSAFARPADRDAAALARTLEAKVMAPVRVLLGDARRVFLSPDGALNLIPFAALTGDDGRPLIERYAFTYLTSGRDLLRFSARVPSRQPPFVVTAPDFDLDTRTGGPFEPLLYGTEVRDTLAARFPQPSPTLLTGREATKARLRQIHGPQFLHLDSHGYFDAKVCTTEPSKELLSKPLLRSGIALAGANACTSGKNDGLLTAAEASDLDLYGTKLVVLSACQTGVGEPKAGDGVYGLRRALVLAGAETQVMSLWPVDSAATAELMKAYYEALAKGGGRSEAMRQVQLAMLHDSRHQHPYYWASFIVSGDDRALDGAVVPAFGRVSAGGACVCGLGGEAPGGGAGGLAIGFAIVACLGRRRPRERAARRCHPRARAVR